MPTRIVGNNVFQVFELSTGLSWADTLAHVANTNYRFNDVRGHLVTVADSSENHAVITLLNRRIGWIALHTVDSGKSVRVFRWAAGPEAGQPATYTNWNTAAGEPNDCDFAIHPLGYGYCTGQSGGEDCVVVNHHGGHRWTDVHCASYTQPRTVVVEYDNAV